MLLQRQELATWEAITTSAKPTPASGEQFALPEAVGLLREVRCRATSQELVSPSGADPLNLVGIVTPGNTAPRGSGRVRYLDGVPIASQSGERRGASSVRAKSSSTSTCNCTSNFLACPYDRALWREALACILVPSAPSERSPRRRTPFQ
ncbi:MAG: hypothetical protein LC647_13985 [Beggiatoa sp.]|nr:hypothetical protein [Beggiatoa sp.]